MCGNGIRCVAKYVYDHGLTDKTTITVNTLSGIKTLKLTVEDGKVSKVRVDMGEPELIPAPGSRQSICPWLGGRSKGSDRGGAIRDQGQVL